MPDHENKTENRGENAGYTFPVPARREAVIVESSSQYTVFSAELSAVDGFSGRILPYVNALDDRYFVPQLRFQGGAYSASFAFTPTMDRIVATGIRRSVRRLRRSGRQRVYWKNCSFRRQIGMAIF